jgi:hypothetical protein
MSRAAARLIVPAPIETRRDAGVSWYEANVDTERRAASLEAFATKDSRLSRAEIQLHPDSAFTTVIEDAGVELTIEARLTRDDSGVQIQGSINGRPFGISEQLGGLDRDAQSELSDTERETLERWARLADSCEAMAQATRQSWGTASCALLYLGVGFSAAACVEGGLAACGAALGGVALALENCT